MRTECPAPLLIFAGEEKEETLEGWAVFGHRSHACNLSRSSSIKIRGSPAHHTGMDRPNQPTACATVGCPACRSGPSAACLLRSIQAESALGTSRLACFTKTLAHYRWSARRPRPAHDQLLAASSETVRRNWLLLPPRPLCSRTRFAPPTSPTTATGPTAVEPPLFLTQ